jgi:hypothetical protein
MSATTLEKEYVKALLNHESRNPRILDQPSTYHEKRCLKPCATVLAPFLPLSKANEMLLIIYQPKRDLAEIWVKDSVSSAGK